MMDTERQGTLHIIVCAAPPASEIQELAKLAKAADWDVAVIATPHALKFMDIATIEQYTTYPVRSDYKQPGELDPFPKPTAVIVAPATFNTINKWAVGIADTLATSMLCEHLGHGVPIVVAPCLKDALMKHPAFSQHIKMLRDHGVSFVHEPYRYKSPKIVPWHTILSEAERMVKHRPALRQYYGHSRITIRSIAQLTMTSAKAFWQGFRQKKIDATQAE